MTPEFEQCMERLAFYGDNKWWLSEEEADERRNQNMGKVAEKIFGV